MEWMQVAKIAKGAFRDGVNQWLQAARISSGGTLINGHTLYLLSPCIGNNFDLNAFLVKSMGQSGVPARLVRPLAEELSSVWKYWPHSVAGTFSGVFPAFVSVRARVAPPTRAIPRPLLAYLNGDPFPKESTVLSELMQETAPLANAAAGDRAEAMKKLAKWVHYSWRMWWMNAMVVGIVGEGPVPTFAPPAVPAGPVAGGKAKSSGPLFASAPFGGLDLW